MDAAKLMELTTEIVEVSGKLNALRAQRDSLTPQILPLEARLTVLMVEHGKLLGSLAGLSVPVPAPVAAPEAPSSSGDSSVKGRVLAYLRAHSGGDEPISATDVAEVLRIDATIVREVMMGLRNAR
jgi:hypothetical protein